MADALKLSLDLSLNDRLVGPLKRALGEVRSELGKVVNGLNKVATIGEQAGRGLSLVGSRTNLVGKAAQEAERGLRGMHSELAGVAEKSEKVAGNLQKVAKEAAGLRNLARATKEVGDAAKDAERKTSAFSRVRAAAGVVAGVAAGSAVIAAPARRAADYDTALRGLANTAYAGKPLAERRAGLAGLDAAITGAVRYGGGTRDQALATLNDLVASGTMSLDDAKRMLPSLQRGGTGSGADPTQLAQIAIRSSQSFKIPSNQIGQVLDMAMAAGQAGGFELRDMAKWLPAQMASARGLGLSGTAGLATLLAANQASVITAGSKDEAGNNLVNLLGKANSSDTAADFKKIGIDLPGSLAAARGKGVDGLTAFVNMVDQIVAADPRFQAARRSAASATGDDRRAAFESQADILQGSSIGKVIQDRQALMALVALMNNRSYTADVSKQIGSSAGAINDAFSLFQEGAGYKFDQRAFDQQEAQTRSMNDANGVLTKLAEAQSALYREYPEFAKAVEGATTMVKAFSVALAGAGLVNMLTGGGGGGLIARGAGAAVGGAGSLVAAAGGAGAVALGGAAATAALGVGYGAGTLLNAGINSADKNFGTNIGAGIGEMTASLLAFFGNQEAQDALNTNRQVEAAAKLEAAAKALGDRPPIKVMINGREITSVLDEQVALDSRRW